MSSYEYDVQISEPQTDTPWIARHWAEMVRTEIVSGNPRKHVLPWTHESAVDYAHQGGASLPEGTEIRIRRRRASNAPRRRGDGPAWVSHRLYLVGVDGIVRRTDR